MVSFMHAANVELITLNSNINLACCIYKDVKIIRTKDCVPLTILITYIFSASLKFRACYITGQWDELTVNNATLNLHMLSLYFLLFFIKKFENYEPH